MDILSIAALVSSLSGNALVNYKRRVGFIVWIVSNILWILVNLLGDTNWCQVLMFIAYMCLNVQGWIVWGRKNEEAAKQAGEKAHGPM